MAPTPRAQVLPGQEPWRRSLDDGAWLVYDPGFLPGDEASALAERLREQVAWEQREVTLFGKSVPQPRLCCWIGEVSYTYSGLRLEPRPWSVELQALRDRVALAVGVSAERFDGVLLNLYRNGRDSMGLHADDEPEIVPGSAIASVSLGEPRRFVLRSRHEPLALEVRLGHGSLLTMGGSVQRNWRHTVPREPRLSGSRINLTFRQHRRT